MAFKRRLKFDKRIKHKKRMDRLFILVIMCFAFLGIGYSYISTSLNINGTANVTAASWDVHFDNLNVTDGSVTATTPADITDDTTIEFAATLEEPGDYYEFTVDVVNSGTMDAMIDGFTISPELTSDQEKYLEYKVTYLDGGELEEKQKLAVGSSEIIKVRFKYIENEDKTTYPTEDQQFTIEFTMTYTQADETAIDVEHSFSNESWENIIENIKTNRIPDYYAVGASKEVNLGTLGVHTLRIANKTSPAECISTLYSETACGFVLEFADVITTHRMNPEYNGNTGTGNKGGWPASEMRTFINNDIYDALPSELKQNIEYTRVISGHGSNDSSNLSSTDKLYLLSTKEIWGKEGTENIITTDSAETETWQLDYYREQGVTTSNHAAAIKTSSGLYRIWWLRSATSNFNDRFFSVSASGCWNYYYSYDTTYFVAPAFRLKNNSQV